LRDGTLSSHFPLNLPDRKYPPSPICDESGKA
jgi:hypothetical protein